MNKLLIAIALPAALAAQQPVPGAAFQNVLTSGNDVVRTINVRSGPGKAVLNRPLTATEERHSVQTLGDGTRIETKTTDKLYRDDQGRTRIEREDGTVSIEDPVAGTGAEISASGKVLRISKFKGSNLSNYAFTTSSSSDEPGIVDKEKLKAEAKAQLDLQVAKIATNNTQVAEGSYYFRNDTVLTEAARKAESRKEENLGVQSTNGILADGARTTTTISQGQIGNDRDINIVAERWYSTDLQMLIKSVNKDPRFGETTYELTNIQQGAPDPSLFKIPAGRLGDSVK